MRLHIDKYKDSNECYTRGEAHAVYESPLDFIMQDICGFCGCGSPVAAARFLRDGLRCIRASSDDNLSYEDFSKMCDTHIGDEGSRYFFFYVMAKLEMTEHGSSVPGWLDGLGYEVLEDLEEILHDDDAA